MTRPILKRGAVVVSPIDTPPISPEDTSRTADITETLSRRATVVADPAVQAIASRTPAQARAWVQANVTNLAQAKDLLGDIAAVLTVLLKKL